MKYENLKNKTSEQFRRLTGVFRSTFEKMLTYLIDQEKIKKWRGGKPNKLSLEIRLLMALEYWREYRTYFHIANSYGISESSCYRNIRWIEDTLIKNEDFALPGKKELTKSNSEYEIILIDATESPIERPKKNNAYIIQEKRNDIL